jgi:hypothetical protein
MKETIENLLLFHLHDKNEIRLIERRGFVVVDER